MSVKTGSERGSYPNPLCQITASNQLYFVFRDWVTLQVVAYLPMLALIGLYFLVPESPRWLIAVGRIDEAKAIIQKGAEINGKTLPDSVFAVIFVFKNKHPVQNQLLFH